jgi:hypothetical protein
MLENLAKVPEGLLIPQDVRVEGFGEGHQCGQIPQRQRAVGRLNVGVLRESELGLHIISYDVQLERGGQGRFKLQRLQPRTGTPRQVVLEAPPPQRRPEPKGADRIGTSSVAPQAAFDPLDQLIESVENIWFTLQFKQRFKLKSNLFEIEPLVLADQDEFEVVPVASTAGECFVDNEILRRTSGELETLSLPQSGT